MTHEIAKILAQSLSPLYDAELITILCGLVKTVSQARDNAIIRFPVPYDTDAPVYQIENSDLIPDHGQRAIVYFEGTDTLISDNQLRKSKASSGLRLVCWYNSERMQVTEGNSLHSLLIGSFLGLLKEARPPQDGIIVAMKAEANRVIDSYDSLFAKYSYVKERGQYLQSPYFAFGIDINVTYQINHGCATKPLPINSADCC